MQQERLISHRISPETLETTLQRISERIKQQGDKSYASVSYQLELLNELAKFDFGRHLLQNQGIDGYWTHYMVTHPWFGRKTGKNNRGEPLNYVEKLILNQSPSVLATQERFEIFLKENQKKLKSKAKLASIPCGMMGELLYLNYENIDDIQLTGIDYDSKVFQFAKELAEEQGLAKFVDFIEEDAWNLSFEEEFDLISSHGLNIYEADDEKVIELYRQFYKALKPDGRLVTSFFTFPPNFGKPCEWDLTQINQNDLLLQKIISVDIIDGKFYCYRSSEQTSEILSAAGFNNIQFIYDLAKIFPTVVAMKG